MTSRKDIDYLQKRWEQGCGGNRKEIDCGGNRERKASSDPPNEQLIVQVTRSEVR